MSKRVNILSLFSTMLLLLTGCEQETSLSPLLPAGGKEPVEIHLSARVAEVSTVVTRAGTDFSTTLTGSTVGLYGLKGRGVSFTDSIYMDNRSLEYDNTNSSLTSGTAKVYFPTGRDSALLYAYCPYTNDPIALPGNATERCIRVKGGMSTTSSAEWTDAPKDPLYAFAKSTIVRKKEGETGATPSGEAKLEFFHRMARLQILVKTNAAEDYRLQAVHVTFASHQHGYMDLRTGEIITADATPETCTETLTDPSLKNVPTPQLDYSALPGIQAVTKIRLTVKIGDAPEGEEYNVFDTEEGGATIDLESGATTKVTINFNPGTQVTASLDNTWQTSEVPIDYNK